MDAEAEDQQVADGALWCGSDAPLIDLPEMDEDLTENFNLKFGNDYLLPAKPEDTTVKDTAASASTSTVASGGIQIKLKRGGSSTSPVDVNKFMPVRNAPLILKRKLELQAVENSTKTARLQEDAAKTIPSSSIVVSNSDQLLKATVSNPISTTVIDFTACDELPCPFTRVAGSEALKKGVMVNHKHLLEMNTKDISVCPLCVQKCSATKKTSYDLLMHVALHKGVQNLHCLCSNCGRYVGRYMEKAANATNIITKETYEKLWLPTDWKWVDVCLCVNPTLGIVFDCVLDIKCFFNLVLLKMQKQPNLKIEVFIGTNSFKEHLESHKQVWVASSLCELCREDPRYCHYRLFKGQYIAVEEDVCITSGFHQGNKVRDSSMYCRLISRPPPESRVETPDSDFSVRFARQPKLAVKGTEAKELDKTTPDAPKQNFGSGPVKPFLLSSNHPGVNITFKRPSKLTEMLSRPGPQSTESSSSVTGVLNVLQKKFRSPGPPVTSTPSVRPSKHYFQSPSLCLDSLVIPFKFRPSANGLVDIRQSFPKLRCPAYKDGCQFASWHLKLMDAHIKSHLKRVNLYVMFACICNVYYHNLFDLFLHLQEKHANNIKTDEEMVSFLCKMDEEAEEENEEKTKEKSLNDLLFGSNDEDVVIARFQSFIWINQLLVASGYIRKVTMPNSARTTWLESPADVENWIQEEKHGMELYKGGVFHMKFEDVPFLDPYLVISVEDIEEDLDFLWSQSHDPLSHSAPLTKEDLVLGVAIDDENKRENKTSMELESVDQTGLPPQIHVISPLLKRSEVAQNKVYTKGINRRPGQNLDRIRYCIKPDNVTLSRWYRLFTQSEHNRTMDPSMEPKAQPVKPRSTKKIPLEQQMEKAKAIESKVSLPKSYKLPPNLNRCQYAYQTTISISGESGNTQVKIIIKEVEDANYHQCPYCTKSVKDIFSISRHMSNHHVVLRRQLQMDNNSKKSIIMLCRHCDFVTFDTFCCWLHLQHAHRARLRPDLDEQLYLHYAKTGFWNNNKIGLFVCQECGWNLSSRRELISHTITAHSYNCKTVQLGYIMTKVVTAAGTDAVCICVFCNEVAANQNFMKWHVCKEHSYGRLLFVCMYCNEYITLYFSKGLISDHYTEHHGHCIPFWCSFSLVGDLDPRTFDSEVTHNSSASLSAGEGTSVGQTSCEIPKAHAGARLPLEDCNDYDGLTSAHARGHVMGEIKIEPSGSGKCIGVEINRAGDIIKTFVMPVQDSDASASTSNVTIKEEDDVESEPFSGTIKLEEVRIKDEPMDTYEEPPAVHVKDELPIDELLIEIKEESVRTLNCAETNIANIASIGSITNTDLEEGEISLETLQASTGVEIKDESNDDVMVVTTEQSETTEVTSFSEEDMVLVMSSDGQQYYIPREQLAQLMEQQTAENS